MRGSHAECRVAMSHLRMPPVRLLNFYTTNPSAVTGSGRSHLSQRAIYGAHSGTSGGAGLLCVREARADTRLYGPARERNTLKREVASAQGERRLAEPEQDPH